MIEIPNGAIDVPDPRDRTYEEVFGAWVIPKDEYTQHNTPILNQWLLPYTKMACTRYGIVKSINEMNFFDSKKEISQNELVKLWRVAIEKYWASETKGDSLQSALKQMKDDWIIEGYTKVSWEYAMKLAITEGRLLFTWTSKCDRVETKKTGYYTPWTWYGHAFAIIGYNKEWFIAINSYWDRGARKWIIIIKYADIPTLFSVYAMSDKKDQDQLQAMQDKQNLQEAKELGIWNGERPKDPVTREECVLMVMRAKKSI